MKTTAEAADRPTVGRWGLLEVRLPGSTGSREKAMDVSFSGPDGGVVDFYGYDQDGWRFRFMPDTVGKWTWTARFGDSPDVTGQFECVPSDIPGPLAALPDNRTWFGDPEGDATLVRSFHVGDCFFTDRPNAATGDPWQPEMRTAFLDWAQGQGYNMLSVASHYLNRRSEGRGEGWETPDLWDDAAGEPRPDAYDRMEAVLDDLAARRMFIYPFAGMFGRDANFPTDPEGQDRYIRYTLARLAPYWNLLLMVGGPEPHLKNKRYLSDDDINRIGRRIRALDPFGHLLSVHNPTGDDCFGQEDWVSYVILQGPKTVDRERLRDDHLRNRRPGKPLYAQETLWPGNLLHSNRIGHDYSLDDIRKNGFVMLFAGAAINFADMDGLSSSGFSGRPDLALKKQPIHDAIRHVWDLFDTLPWQDCSPKPDAVDTGHCLAGDDVVMVYSDTPTPIRVTVDGTWSAETIDAQTGSVRKAESSEDIYDPPEGAEDWILVLRKT